MSLPRRRRLVELARERELIVLEDNPYGMLRYEGDALPTLRSIEAPAGSPEAGDFVIYTGTMSKILSPGVRVGWLVAPRPVLAKLILGKQSADLCSSSLAQHFVAAYFAAGDWQPYVGELRDLYRRRRDVILDALAEHLPAQAQLDAPAGRPLHLGHAARLHRHDEPAGARARGERRVRPRTGGVRRRPRQELDAAELLVLDRRGPARGGAPDRR